MDIRECAASAQPSLDADFMPSALLRFAHSHECHKSNKSAEITGFSDRAGMGLKEVIQKEIDDRLTETRE